MTEAVPRAPPKYGVTALYFLYQSKFVRLHPPDDEYIEFFARDRDPVREPI